MKISSIILGSVALAFSVSAQATLIAHYTFDDSSQRTADSSGNNYHGNEIGTVNYTAGISGDAMSVAGGGKVVYDPGIPVSLSSFALSFWATDSSVSWKDWIEMNAGDPTTVGFHVQSTGSNGVALYRACPKTPCFSFSTSRD